MKDVAQHTPGPWHFYDRGIGYEVHAGPPPPDDEHWWMKDESHPQSGECRNICNDGCKDTISNAANARLIASAPELLAALERYVDCDGYEDALKVQARGAIAKATGQAVAQ